MTRDPSCRFVYEHPAWPAPFSALLSLDETSPDGRQQRRIEALEAHTREMEHRYNAELDTIRATIRVLQDEHKLQPSSNDNVYQLRAANEILHQEKNEWKARAEANEQNIQAQQEHIAMLELRAKEELQAEKTVSSRYAAQMDNLKNEKEEVQNRMLELETKNAQLESEFAAVSEVNAALTKRTEQAAERLREERQLKKQYQAEQMVLSTKLRESERQKATLERKVEGRQRERANKQVEEYEGYYRTLFREEHAKVEALERELAKMTRGSAHSGAKVGTSCVNFGTPVSIPIQSEGSDLMNDNYKWTQVRNNAENTIARWSDEESCIYS